MDEEGGVERVCGRRWKVIGLASWVVSLSAADKGGRRHPGQAQLDIKPESTLSESTG